MKVLASAYPAKYKVGMWAFVLHRVSGLVIALYLVVHIAVISTAAVSGNLAFNNLMDTMHLPWVVALELGLIGVVLYHLLNGVRLLLFDIGIGVRQQKPIFWGLMVLGVVLMVFSTMALWSLIFR